MSRPVVKESKWDKDGVPGQREFTKAMAHWLDNEQNVHYNCLENSLKGFDIIMGLMQSAYDGKALNFPCKADDDIVHKLEEKFKN